MLQERTAQKKDALDIGILRRARKNYFLKNKRLRVLLLANER